MEKTIQTNNNNKHIILPYQNKQTLLLHPLLKIDFSSPEGGSQYRVWRFILILHCQALIDLFVVKRENNDSSIHERPPTYYSEGSECYSGSTDCLTLFSNYLYIHVSNVPIKNH
mmetsp:Transcript_23524/g.36165  ORF Transcript_23524/g.36165 Transcript_23524/m.36165 type:complete len:114 (+) Transcript_23524:512-853(+)